MKINRKNYELYFLDYWEAKLSADEKAMLMNFLKENADLQQEFYDFEDIRLPDDEAIYPQKTKLKKNILPVGNITAENHEQFFIGALENDLETSETEKLGLFLESNPKLQNTFAIYQNLKIKPDAAIVFPAKNSLKKKPMIIFWRQAAIVAAAVAALFIVFFGIRGLFSPDPLRTESSFPAKMAIIVPSVEILTSSDIFLRNSARPTAFYNSESIADKERMWLAPLEALTFNEELALAENPDYYLMINRTEYTLLADQLNLELLAAGPDKQKAKKKKTALGKIFAGLFNSTKEAIVPEREGDNKKVSIWSIAELGVKGYNNLTDNDYALHTKKDDSGKVTSYTIKDDMDKVVFEREAKQKE